MGVPPVWVFRTLLPLPQPVCFEELVRNVDAGTRTALQQTGALRAEYAGAVVSDSAAAALRAAEAYLPRLLGFVEATEAVSAELVRQTAVVWEAPLSVPARVTGPSVRFDHAMVLVALGLAHRRRADELLAACGRDAGADAYRAASAELCAAAGVFEHCARLPLSAWAGAAAGGTLVELSSAFHRAMAELSLMEAQSLAVRKGVVCRVGLGALNRVASGVLDRAARCRQALADARHAVRGDQPHLAALDHYVTLHAACYRALLCRRLGADALAAGAYGHAAAYAAQGLPDPAAEHLLHDSRVAAALPGFLAAITPVLTPACATFAMWQRDNTNIYYERVPSPAELPLPAPALLSKPTPYSEPAPIVPHISCQSDSCLLM